MTKDISGIDAFGAIIALSSDPTVKTGRCSAQREVERHLFLGVVAKLKPKAEVRVLDIGCGAGKAFELQWADMMIKHQSVVGEDAAFVELARSEMLGAFAEEEILTLTRIARAEGCDSWLLPQSPDFPFGNAHEDLLIVRH